MTTIRSVLQDAFTGTISASGIVCTNPIPFSWTLEEAATFRLRTVLDLGTVHIEPGTVGQVDLTAGFWIAEAGTGAPTSSAPTATSNTWDTRHCVRHATKQISYHGVGVMDYETPGLDAGDWEMWVGIGGGGVVDLDTVGLTGYTPSGFIDLYGFEVNF